MAAGPNPSPLALWVVPVADLAGVARHVLDVARVGLPGWRLVVLCPEGPLALRLRQQGSAVMTGPFGSATGPVTSIRTVQRAARALRPAVVHSHLAYADIVVAAARLNPGARRFTTEHGIAGDDAVYHGSAAKSRLMAAVHTARLRRFDGVIAVSEATKRAMIAKWHPRQQIRVIHNGVDAPERARSTAEAVPDDRLRVLSLSRLSPEKRIDKVLEAFAVVHAERPDATLTIAGTGELEPELREQAAALGIADAVSFPGFVNAEDAMAEADVLAQLSVWENCSYSLLDASVRGLRIVASNVGGNPEIVDTASLVDAVDVAAVARRLAGSRTRSPARSPSTVAAMCARIVACYAASAATIREGTRHV